MYLYRATRDPYFLEVGRDMLESIEHSARTPCGYATVSLDDFNTSVLSSLIEYKLSCEIELQWPFNSISIVLGKKQNFLLVSLYITIRL